MYHLQRSIIVQGSHLNDPPTVNLQYFLVINPVQPKLDIREIPLHLDPNPVQMLHHLTLGRNHPQQDVLPETIDLNLLKSQHKRTAVFITIVLPDRLYLVFEEVEAGTDFHLRRPFEVLVVGPELLDSCDRSHRMETVFETFTLRKLLVPKFERTRQRQGLSWLLHNI